MRTLTQDMRYNARILLKNPGFRLAAVLTLALSIDASASTFGIVEGKKAGNTFSAQEANQDNDAELIAQAQAKSNSQAWAEAAALWEKVVARNPVNGSFWHQLASAHYRARDYRRAIPAYQKVIALGAVFPSSAAYQIARCHAVLGEKDAALKWLEQAFEMGFRDLQAAQTDADWENLRDDPRYRKIVSLVDVSKLSRNEGWRLDLQLMARDVKRKGYAFARPISKEEFDVEVKKLNDSIPGLTDMQVTIEMMKLLRRVGDGHTGLLGSRSRVDWQQTLPMQFYQFEEGLFIIAADPRYKELLGTQVLRFDERAVDQVISALEPLIPRDNEIWVKQRAPYLMRHLPLLHGLGLIPSPGKATLSLRDTNGMTRQVQVVTDQSQPNIWNVFPNPSGWINRRKHWAARPRFI